MSTRQRKTPQQRAQEQYDVACRAVERLTGKLSAARDAVAELEEQRDAAVVRRNFLAKHPDLQESEGDDR